MKHTPLTLITIAALTLTACGNTQAQEEPQSVEQVPMEHNDPMPAGEYEAYAEAGGHILMQIPADPTDEAIAEIEEYREAAGAEPATYLLADVDNRQGNDSIGMRNVFIYDEAGTEYVFSGASDYISDIGPETDWADDEESYSLADGTEISRAEYFELDDISTDLHNEHMYGASAAERKTIILVYQGDDLPDEFTRVAVQPGPFGEEVEAYPSD